MNFHTGRAFFHGTEQPPSTPVIARSEATWQSVFLLQDCLGDADCHTILRMVRNDMGI
jgi:hypothetical protein